MGWGTINYHISGVNVREEKEEEEEEEEGICLFIYLFIYDIYDIYLFLDA